MPTEKTRVNLSLDDEMNALIAKIAQFKKIPKARVITEFLEECRPQFRVLCEAIDQIQANEAVNPSEVLAQMLSKSFKNLSTAMDSIKSESKISDSRCPDTRELPL